MENLEGRRMMAVFTVDDNFASDNVALRRYDTIQEAVTAATAGNTIKVKPGTYEENVLVTRNCRLKARMLRYSKYLDPTKAAIVDPVDDGILGNPAIAFDLAADGISIEGFTIGEFDSAADADGNVGIRTSASFSGYEIEDNVIENDTIGNYLNTLTTLNGRIGETNRGGRQRYSQQRCCRGGVGTEYIPTKAYRTLSSRKMCFPAETSMMGLLSSMHRTKLLIPRCRRTFASVTITLKRVPVAVFTSKASPIPQLGQ